MEDNDGSERFIFFHGKKRSVDDVAIIRIVLGAGALGGFGAAAMGVEVPFGPAKRGEQMRWMNWWQLAFTGMMAAGVMVFYLARTDTRNVLRTVFFSVVCGLTGPAIIRSVMQNPPVPGALGERAQNDTERADQLTQKTANVAKEADLKKVEQYVGESLTVALDAITTTQKAEEKNMAAAKVGSENAALKIVDNLAVVANEVAMVKPEAVSAPIDALVRIADEAKKTNNTVVLEKATKQLQKLPPRLYLEVGKLFSSADLQLLQKRLKDKAVVPKQEFLADVSDNEVRILYYREDDKAGADAMVETMRQFAPLAAARAEKQHFKGVSNARPRHFDIKLGKVAVDEIATRLNQPAATPAPQQ